jgi:hypothetical protein
VPRALAASSSDSSPARLSAAAMSRARPETGFGRQHAAAAGTHQQRALHAGQRGVRRLHLLRRLHLGLQVVLQPRLDHLQQAIALLRAEQRAVQRIDQPVAVQRVRAQQQHGVDAGQREPPAVVARSREDALTRGPRRAQAFEVGGLSRAQPPARGGFNMRQQGRGLRVAVDFAFEQCDEGAAQRRAIAGVALEQGACVGAVSVDRVFFAGLRLIGGVQLPPGSGVLASLGLIHRDVGLAQQLAGQLCVVREQRDTHRQRELDASAARQFDAAGGRVVQSLQRRGQLRLRLLAVETFEDDDELVAAQPRQQLVVAQGAAQPRGERDQQLVADRVSPGVVDLFEIVEVEHADGDGSAAAPRLRECLRQALVERIAVGRSGQRIGAGLPQQRLLASVARGDVVEAQQARRGAVESRSRRRGRQMQHAAVGAAQHEFLAHLRSRTAQQRVDRVGVVPVGEFAQAGAARCDEQRLRRRVRVQQRAVADRAQQRRCRQLVQHVAEITLLVRELLGALAHAALEFRVERAQRRGRAQTSRLQRAGEQRRGGQRDAAQLRAEQRELARRIGVGPVAGDQRAEHQRVDQRDGKRDEGHVKPENRPQHRHQQQRQQPATNDRRDARHEQQRRAERDGGQQQHGAFAARAPRQSVAPDAVQRRRQHRHRAHRRGGLRQRMRRCGVPQRGSGGVAQRQHGAVEQHHGQQEASDAVRRAPQAAQRDPAQRGAAQQRAQPLCGGQQQRSGRRRARKPQRGDRRRRDDRRQRLDSPGQHRERRHGRFGLQRQGSRQHGTRRGRGQAGDEDQRLALQRGSVRKQHRAGAAATCRDRRSLCADVNREAKPRRSRESRVVSPCGAASAVRSSGAGVGARVPAHHERAAGGQGGQRRDRGPAGGAEQRAAQRRARRHADEHREDQHRIEPAARVGVEPVNDRLVRDERGLDAEVEADRRDADQPQRSAWAQACDQQQRGKRQRDQRGAELGDGTGPAAVGHAPGQRRGQRAGRAGQPVGAGRGAAEMERRRMQGDGQRRPERAERDHQQTLRPGRGAQRPVATPQHGQRRQERAVAQRRGRRHARQPARGDHGQQRDAQRRAIEHHAPAVACRHGTADDPRQQDAEQQPHHHLADHAAAYRRRRQRRRGRHDVLRQRREHADGEAGGTQPGQRRRVRRGEQRDDQRLGFQHDHAATVVAVAQRRQQRDADRVAELRQHRDQPQRARRRAEVGADHREHRLVVVQRGHRQSGAPGEQQGQRGVEAARGGGGG